ncbi:MAG: T9SS type A sorting domain-containing protein [candidate division WOR-3 bacterium]|nr:MAG: T9SS type A sorting domain-containing protein [candidate division WOR-3 bacterium]
MKYLLCLLMAVNILAAGITKPADVPGIEIETSADGTRFVTEPSGDTPGLKTATDFCGNHRAEVIWVDRNHQNAIAQHTAIAGNGMWIQAGWYLNNERTSLYRTLGTNTPMWTFPMSGADWFISTDVSMYGAGIGVLADGEACYSFSSASAAPNWVYSPPTGFNFSSSAQGPTISVADDGSVYAALAGQAGQGRLFLFDAAGDTIRTVGFNPTRGIYGVDMANDASVICVSTYDAIYVFNADGSRRDSIMQYGQTPAKISADGKYLVKGDFYTRVYLYRWNGSDYDQVWQHPTGHPWVTSVAISDDGSTIMAGTFQYSPSNTGKVLLFDSSSATPLWEYTQYGDYVPTCALSEDGARAVAGSWGQYNATFGDVLTVFDRNSSTPIFQLLDDIDEPGSIFSVDISKDGSFITAGGKAVHARQFGSGGEVYAIRMLDPLTNDVGIERINAPAAFLQVGQNITPQAIARNYGAQPASFSVVCYIHDSLAQPLYGDTAAISGLASGSSTTVSFTPNWNVPAYGRYLTTAFTTLSGDEFPQNDTLTQTSICYHDGTVLSISYPFSEITLNYTGAPRVTVANHGSYTEQIPVNCEIYDDIGTLVYSGNGQSYLNPFESQVVTVAPSWSPSDTGLYDAYFFTDVPDDYVPSNDTMATAFDVTTEIMYDDGFLDTYGYVSTTFADNKFAEKMMPCLSPPYYITQVRFYCSNDSMIAVSLHKDSTSLPGLDPSYYIAAPDTINGAGPGWAIKEYTPPIQVTTGDPFWMVVHWLSGSPTAPYIGMDNTQPLDYLSYWYWTDPSDPGWHAWTTYDFMMRVMTVSEVGIESWDNKSVDRFMLPAPSPNPFVRDLRISFSVPHSGALSISVYDIAGRLVSNIVDRDFSAGEYEIVWNGKDNMERRISSGVYFVRASYGNEVTTRKVILLTE